MELPKDLEVRQGLEYRLLPRGVTVARFNPYAIQMQLTRMFKEGQSFFAVTKVQDWLREHNEDPQVYEIIFHKKPAPSGSEAVFVIKVELRRRDGQPVAAWLQRELNQPG